MNEVVVTKDEITSTRDDMTLVSVVLNDVRGIKYQSDGGRYMKEYLDQSSVIVGFTRADSFAVISLADVRELTTEKRQFSAGRTILFATYGVFVVVSTVGTVVLVAALSHHG